MAHRPAGGSIAVAVAVAVAVVVAETWRIELTTPRTIMESYKVLRVGAAEIEQHRDGLVVLDRIPVLMSKIGLFDRSKAPAPVDAQWVRA